MNPDENLGAKLLELSQRWNVNDIINSVNPSEAPPPGYDALTGGMLPYRQYVASMIPYISEYPMAPGARITQPAWDCAMYAWRQRGLDAGRASAYASISGCVKSRYPIDLNGLRVGFDFDDPKRFEPPHLKPLMDLSMTFKLDAFIAGVDEKPHEAMEAILAMRAIAASLENEPIIRSQSFRLTILDMAVESTQDALSRTTFAPEDMALLQSAFSSALPPVGAPSIFERPVMLTQLVMMEPIRYDNMTSEFVHGFFSFFESPSGVMSRAYVLRSSARITERAANGPGRDSLNIASLFTGNNIPSYSINLRAPLIIFNEMFSSVAPSTYDKEWRVRTRLDAIRTALAVEQFRRIENRLPETLDELVPAYLEGVAMDPFTKGTPLTFYCGPFPAPTSPDINSLTPVEYRIEAIPRDISMVTFDGRTGKPGESYGDWGVAIAPLDFRASPDVVPDTGGLDVFGGKAMMENAA